MKNKDKVAAVLGAIETGDPGPFAFINPSKYIQHNLSIPDGIEGIAGVVGGQPPGTFKAKVIRVFEDGDFAFAHTVYDFFGPKVGFDVFRFENGLIVEHWDNLIEVMPMNRSGRTQTDGAVTLMDEANTESNKRLVKGFIADIWIGREQNHTAYMDPSKYMDHNPFDAGGLVKAETGVTKSIIRIHKILGEGNFVLAMSEGMHGKDGVVPTSFYDLFRVESGKIVEHWDVIEPMLPKAQWRNSNGKF